MIRLAACSSLVFASLAPAQIRVALCGGAATSSTSCHWSSVQSALLGTGLFAAIDLINVTTGGTGTPTLEQLGRYDALLCWTNNSPADNNAWGNVLADYVDQGGGVVVAVFANSTLTPGRNIGGRWQSGYEVVLDQGGTTSVPGGLLGTVLLPAHPVMAGVTSFVGGTLASRPTSTALEVGATLIAQWNDGRVLVAEGARPNRIDLGFFPSTNACSQTGWAIGGDQLMANALLYVARTAAYHPFGSGCAGSLGTPVLSAAAGAHPAVGTLFTANVDHVPQGLGLMVLGFSDASSGGVPLPLDLTLAGLTGCSLRVELAQLDAFPSLGTTGSWAVFIPPVPAFLGAHFYNQAAVLDPLANPFGWTLSNACRARIGV